jgi:hypothetical protein
MTLIGRIAKIAGIAKTAKIERPKPLKHGGWRERRRHGKKELFLLRICEEARGYEL